MPILLLLISLTLSVPAWADDLGMAGALSGLGQGMGRGFEQMQSGIMQQGLMQQRQRHDLQLQTDRHQRDLESMRRQHAEWSAQNQDERDAITAEAKILDNTRGLLEEEREFVLSMKHSEDYKKMVLDWERGVHRYNARLDKLNALRAAYRARRASQVSH